MTMRSRHKLVCCVPILIFLVTALPARAQDRQVTGDANMQLFVPPDRSQFSVGLIAGIHQGLILDMMVWRYGGIELFAGTSDHLRHKGLAQVYRGGQLPSLRLMYKQYIGMHSAFGLHFLGALAGGGSILRIPERYHSGATGSGILEMTVGNTPLAARLELNVFFMNLSRELRISQGWNLGLAYRFE